MLCDDKPGKLTFWVQGQGAARRELNKLNQLFGSGKISKAKRETKSDSTKPGKQYLHFQEIKSLQSCSSVMKNNSSLKKTRVLHVYQQCTMQPFMTVTINEVILQPLASQEITLHAKCG
jgi:hypothetical protein